MAMDDAVPEFARLYVHPDDRERFEVDYSKDSLTELYNSKAGYRVNWYRTIRDGKYIWMIYTVIAFEFLDKWYVLSLARDLMDAGMPEHEKVNKDRIYIPEGTSDVPDEIYGKQTETIAKELLHGSDRLQNMVNMMDVGIFWKDSKRRFLGANKYFLDYYGLSSVSDIIGKNDEEVGWHIHSDGFRNDEEDVLNSGISIRGSIGTCLKKGEIRTIMAYKRPVIVDGKIEGLLGYFFDITEAESEAVKNRYAESLSDMNGHNGFYEVLDLYINEYERNRTDFVEICVELDGFDQYTEINGAASAGKTLLALLEGLQNIVGVDSVICHIGNGEIRILHQIKNDSDAALLRQKVGTGVASILGNDMRAIVHGFLFSEMNPDDINEINGFKI
jgi:PAS domain-containing protein/GGDEF domain-containing protein